MIILLQNCSMDFKTSEKVYLFGFLHFVINFDLIDDSEII